MQILIVSIVRKTCSLNDCILMQPGRQSYIF